MAWDRALVCLRRERLGCWAWVWRRNSMKWADILRDWGSLKMIVQPPVMDRLVISPTFLLCK